MKGILSLVLILPIILFGPMQGRRADALAQGANDAAPGPRGEPPEMAPSEPAPPPDHSKELAEVVFSVGEYRVDGNSLLPVERVNEILSNYVGLKQHFEDIENARAMLEKAYHEAGYPTALVVVPEQTIENGVVRLTVIESKLGKIEITGNRHFLQGYILDKLPSLKTDQILYEPAVLKELNEVNANPDLKVTPILSAGDAPGTVDLKLQVEDRLPLHASLEWNNRGTPNTPRQRLSGSIQYNNLFNRDQIVTLQTTQTPQAWGDVAVYGLSYVIPFGGGHTLAMYGAVSKSKSSLDGSSLPIFPGEINIAGNATVLGGRYLFPLSDREGRSDQLALGIDYKRIGKSEAAFPGELGTALISNRVYYAPASIAYTGLRSDKQGITRVSTSARAYIAGLIPGGEKEDFGGLPFDPSNPSAFDAKPGNRKGATGTFGVIQAGVDRSQYLPKGFLLSGKIDGQLANQPLIASEEYFAGGLETVRGYRENEALGDDALHLTLEITSPALPPVLPSRWKENLRLAAFYDDALLWVKQAPPGQKSRFVLRGTGVGARLALTDYIQARVDQAWALRDTSITKKGDYLTQFVIKISF